MKSLKEEKENLVAESEQQGSTSRNIKTVDRKRVRELVEEELKEAPPQSWNDAITEISAVASDAAKVGKKVWDLAQFVLNQIENVTQTLEGSKGRNLMSEDEEILCRKVVAKYEQNK